WVSVAASTRFATRAPRCLTGRPSNRPTSRCCGWPSRAGIAPPTSSPSPRRCRANSASRRTSSRRPSRLVAPQAGSLMCRSAARQGA
ncbi:MAG: hypothetical protein AVDCRST_MAG88-4003, partial [uncultured Thermomicrobiales bacterium]